MERTVQGPMISVIVPSFNAGKTIARALRALEEQQTAVPYEVIVVDSGTDGAAELVARRFPEVRLVRSADRRYAGGARNLGIVEARGEIFAFTDADCLVAPDWIDAVARAHEAPDPVVGGCIGNGNPESYVGWGYYFAEFSKWLPGTAGGATDDVAGCCWSMKSIEYCSNDRAIEVNHFHINIKNLFCFCNCNTTFNRIAIKRVRKS